MESEERKYQIELTGLITLLAKHLYSNPDVFLREMVQNAHDSIVARRELQPSDAPAPRIEIGVDRSARTLTVSDNGRGLTRTEIIDHLATIGRSGTGELRANFEDRGQAVSLIGQFGIGLLSGFIVADNIIVETRSQDDAPLRWRSDGSEQYTIEAGIRDEVGTTLTLHLRQDQDRYLDPVTIRMLVRRYADFIGVPIHVAGDEHPTNAVDAPWHRPNQAHQSSARALEFWFTRFPHERPLHVFSADEPFDMPTADGRARTGHVRGVLAISDRVVLDASAMGTADLYVQRMFVGEANRDILPPWANIIQGVVECDDLALNAARDSPVRNDTLVGAQMALGKRIMRELTSLLRSDHARFVSIMNYHHLSLMLAALRPEHDQFFREVADLVPLECGNEHLTVPEYLKTAATLTDGRPIIYHISAGGSRIQYDLLSDAQGVRAFAGGEFTHEFLRRYVETWPNKAHLARYDLGDSAMMFSEVTGTERELFRTIENAYHVYFPSTNIQPRLVRFQPATIATLISESAEAEGRRKIENLARDVHVSQPHRQILEQFISGTPEPVNLNLNVDSPLVQRLAQRELLDDPVARAALALLHQHAAIVHRARDVGRRELLEFFAAESQTLKLLLDLSDEAAQLRTRVTARETELIEATTDRDSVLSQHVSCFIALPYHDDQSQRLYEAFRQVLEAEPYLWQVVRADDDVEHPGLWDNMKAKLTRAHCFIAVLSGANPNVMIEVGRMEALGRPILLIQHDDHQLPADLTGRLYDTVSDIGELPQQARKVLDRHPAFTDQSGEPFLSASVLTGAGLRDDDARQLARIFSSCRELAGADPDTLGRRLGMAPGLILVAQSHVQSVLNVRN